MEAGVLVEIAEGMATSIAELQESFNGSTDNPWNDLAEEVDITFKIRHTPEFTKGKILKTNDGYRVVSDEKIQGIAPGQFGVIYDADRHICIGSGEIKSSDISRH